MNKKLYNVGLQIKDNNAKVIQGINQFETGAILAFSISNGCDTFSFYGYTEITIVVHKPDGSVYVNEVSNFIDHIEPEHGQINLVLPAELTAQIGMHVCELHFWAGGYRLASGRFNYFIADPLYTGDYDEEMMTSENYPILEQMISQVSEIQEAEQSRLTAEAQRQSNEAQRVSETDGIVALARAAQEAAQGAAEAAQGLYEAIVEYGGEISGIDLTGIASKSYVAGLLAAYNLGAFDGTHNVLQIRRGLADDIPALMEGELGYATDTENMYIGTGTDNVLLNAPCFVAQSTAPTDTSKLWIDTAHSNVLKFHNGTAWTSCNIATFG